MNGSGLHPHETAESAADADEARSSNGETSCGVKRPLSATADDTGSRTGAKRPSIHGDDEHSNWTSSRSKPGGVGERNSLIETLCLMFPDCDPAYVENRVAWHGLDEDRALIQVVDELTEGRYPFLKVSGSQRRS